VVYNAGHLPANALGPYMTSATSVDIDLNRMGDGHPGDGVRGGDEEGALSHLMNYLMPQKGHVSLHSGCNMSKAGDVTLFFGLSGEPPVYRPCQHQGPLPVYCWCQHQGLQPVYRRRWSLSE